MLLGRSSAPFVFVKKDIALATLIVAASKGGCSNAPTNKSSCRMQIS